MKIKYQFKLFCANIKHDVLTLFTSNPVQVVQEEARYQAEVVNIRLSNTAEEIVEFMGQAAGQIMNDLDN